MKDKGKPDAPPADVALPYTLHDADIAYTRAALLAWGSEHFQAFPWRYADQSWHALVAEVLLQRTRASSVVPVYVRFCEFFPTPRDLAEAPSGTIEDVIRPLGLRWRAPLLKQLGSRLAELSGNPPTSLTELKALPGVGTYAASAWLGFHGGRRAVIVDSNVVRWLCRIGNRTFNGETRRKKWLLQIADALTPVRDWKAYNYAVLDFTIQVCSRVPQCAACPFVSNLCLHGSMLDGGPMQ